MAADNEFPTTDLTRSENQPSSPTLMVSPAKIATLMVGISAINANTPVRRRCRRDPADLARRAEIRVATWFSTKAATKSM